MQRSECIKRLEATVVNLIAAYDERHMVSTTYFGTWNDAYQNVDANSDAAARRSADSIAFPERQALAEVDVEIQKLQEQRDYYRAVLPYLED